MEDKKETNETKKVPIIGIRRENKNKWERRLGIIPSDCKKLADSGVRILIQPSEIRCFSDKQFHDFNSKDIIFQEDIEDANVVVGIKEVPIENLIANKTFLFFSHTIKGQSHNMPLLKKLLDLKIRLIDYECIRDLHPTNSQRLVAFGRYAGIVGVIDFLQGVGEFLIHKTIFTPFTHVGYSYMYPSIEDAKENMKRVGEMIKVKKFPKEICPFIIGITGNGKVSKGSQEVLDLLPHEYIEPENIKSLFEKGAKVHHDRVYIVIIEAKHMYRHKEKNDFDKIDFYRNPKSYKSIFAPHFLPYLSLLVHGMFWNSDSDVIISKQEAHDYAVNKQFRIFGITDITCDIGGSVSLMKKLTTIDKPFYTINPINEEVSHDPFENLCEDSILYHAVDHLPAEFPLDASKHFSKNLITFMKALVESKYPINFEDQTGLPQEIINAEMTCNGKLTPRFSYLYKELAKVYPEYKDLVVEEKDEKK